VVLVANSLDVVEKVLTEIELQIKNLPRGKTASKALENSILIVLGNFEEQINLINEYAPEHLIISTKNYPDYIDRITNAGSVFLGEYTPESAGDYASGTNHTLPTNGWARSYSGVNLDSFMKKITFQEISKEGLKNIGPAIEIMAATEELEAHKNAVTLRLNYLTI
jgi:histidinol dehydrogenase